MKSRRNADFRAAFAKLPDDVKTQARNAYRLFRDNPAHPSLYFKQIHPSFPFYSARVGIHYRAVGICRNETIVWFWIGHHTEYDKLLKKL